MSNQPTAYDLIAMHADLLAAERAAAYSEDMPRPQYRAAKERYERLEVAFRAACTAAGVRTWQVPDALPLVPFYDDETGTPLFQCEREEMQRRACAKLLPLDAAREAAQMDAQVQACRGVTAADAWIVAARIDARREVMRAERA